MNGTWLLTALLTKHNLPIWHSKMEPYKPLLHQTTFWCFHYWQRKRLIRRRKTLLNVNHSTLKNNAKQRAKLQKWKRHMITVARFSNAQLRIRLHIFVDKLWTIWNVTLQKFNQTSGSWYQKSEIYCKNPFPDSFFEAM